MKTVEQDIGSLRQYDVELSSDVGFLLDSTDRWYTRRFSLSGFGEILGASRSLPEAEHRSYHGFISTLPNVAAMAAAIYFSAPALFTVAMTTLGTIFCYWRASGLLKESSPEFDIVPESTN